MRWLAAMLMLVAAMVVPTTAWAQDSFSYGDFLYSVTSTEPENETVEVKSYTGSGVEVNIPGMVENNSVVYSVTSIGNSAFINNTTITAITGGENIKEIGTSAFEGCTNLTSVGTLLNNITSISEKAFYGCTSLKGDITLTSAITQGSTIPVP